MEVDMFQMGFHDKITRTSDELDIENERKKESRYNEVSHQGNSREVIPSIRQVRLRVGQQVWEVRNQEYQETHCDIFEIP